MIIKPRQSNADFYAVEYQRLEVLPEDDKKQECPHKGKRGGCACP